MPNDMIFEGFEPTLELKSLAKELLWYLEGRSPSTSSSVARLSKAAQDYQGELEISYNTGVLRAVSSHINPEECLQDLYKKALSQVKEWAFSRHQGEDL